MTEETSPTMAVAKHLAALPRDEWAEKLFYLFARQPINEDGPGESDVVETAAALGVSRGWVVFWFKQLAAVGCGQFVVGRRGYPSRFVWKFHPCRVANTALTGEDELAPTDWDLLASDESADETREHADEEAPEAAALDDEIMSFSFPLRRGFAVQLNLPASLKKAEADRLAAFIQALPVD